MWFPDIQLFSWTLGETDGSVAVLRTILTPQSRHYSDHWSVARRPLVMKQKPSSRRRRRATPGPSAFGRPGARQGRGDAA